ncbi:MULTISPECIES: YoaK family protein [unclassified Sphingomonas]|uniref:YoaK family protein n=1 Tax=unclassified Sphingomonas TaxID=196159 RepID=UPI00226AF32C|nr:MULTISPECIES: YoaK family protein [unclassified Sphingomonas]
MRRFETGPRLLAIGLAMLAGFVDALGFLKLGGLFVSFMSGNSTRMAVGLAGDVPNGLAAAVLIPAFVGGVMTGATIGRIAGRWRRQAVLAFVLTALAMAAAAATLGIGPYPAPLLMAAAMGAANAVFQRDGEVSVGVTYMTGTLVKLGQHLAAALAGGPRFAWVPYLLLWLGLVAGAIAGAAVFPVLGLRALWIATAGAALLLAAAAALGPTRER